MTGRSEVLQPFEEEVFLGGSERSISFIVIIHSFVVLFIKGFG